MDQFFLGRSFSWWISIRRTLDLFAVRDADHLAFMLRSRGNSPMTEPSEPSEPADSAVK